MIDLASIKNFTAVDVELANSDLHSICEIGVARFCAGNLVETWRAILDPACEFEEVFHSRIHGIRRNHVNHAPRFPDVHETLRRMLLGDVCIYHAASDFDLNCIRHACERYGLDDITRATRWLSTLDLASQCWPKESSYKLESLCRKINHEYHPHNALEDSIACAALFRALSESTPVPAIAASGKSSSNRPRTFRRVATLKRGTGLKGREDAPFAGTFMVYSGVFSPPYEDRSNWEDFLCNMGFTPRNSFSRKTKFLVVGENAGRKKIETANEKNIPIMTESEFLDYIKELRR